MALKRDVIADICFRWGRNGSNWGIIAEKNSGEE